jgi:membrane protein
MRGTRQNLDILPRRILRFGVESFRAWQEDRCASRSASLAFYTALSIAPLLVIAVATAGAVFGTDAASGAVVRELGGLIGAAGAELLQELLVNARNAKTGVWATVVAAGTLLIGATTAFAEMKDSLDDMWGGAQGRHIGGLVRLLRTRLLSLGMVLVLGFLLLVSLILSAALAAVQGYLGAYSALVAGRVATACLSFVLVSLLFAAIFKFLPERRLSWRDAVIGALVTAFLFMIGRFGIGFYIGNSAIASSFGAAASVVVLMLWTYYSAMIFLLGAEFARLRASGWRRGPKAKPLQGLAASKAPRTRLASMR